MAGLPLELRRSYADGTLAALPPGFSRVGLDGALASPERALRPSTPRASAVTDGYRWPLFDERSSRWWPQGIAVGEHGAGKSDGRPLALVSWYAKPGRGGSQGSRISVIDLSDPIRAGYRHVLLVSPRATRTGAILEPVRAHAGGIAWAGDRLLVAATLGGIREFRLSDILRAESPASGVYGYSLVLPQHSFFQPADSAPADRMRYSFLTTRESTRAADPDGTLQLVAGEYRNENNGRVALVSLDGDRGTVLSTHVPGVARMQGAAVVDGTWYLSSSNGNAAGDLWYGAIDRMSAFRGVLPPGPEALAFWGTRGELWSVSEIPGKRWLYRISTADGQAAPFT